MVTVTLTYGSASFAWSGVEVSSVSLGRDLLGQSVRALDGTLLTYVGGAKRETAISVLADIADALTLQEWEDDGRELTFSVEDHNGVDLSSYSCVLGGLGVDYSQTDGIASVSFTAREV